MGAKPKTKTPRNAKYLAFIRNQMCLMCGRLGPSEAAHVRMQGNGGMGLKPSDYRTVPLCSVCHNHQHNLGEKSFWETSPRDPFVSMMAFMQIYMATLEDVQATIEALSKVIEENR